MIKHNFFRCILSVVSGIFIPGFLLAQDIHFSQLEFTPLALNPALAGANNRFQGVVNYRSQWASVVQPFQTAAASFDGRLTKEKNARRGYLAAGVFFFNDNAGNPRITTTNVNLNLAYHAVIGRKSTFGLGLYTGYGQRALGDATGRWASQYDGFSYNASASSGETFNNLSFSYLDAGLGLLYTYGSNAGYISQNKTRKWNVGLSFYHVNRPNHSFVGDGLERLPMRVAGFVNAEIGIQNTVGSFLPGVYVQSQGSATEILFGSYYKYSFNSGSKYTAYEKPLSLSIGLFNRWRDAIISRFLVEWDRYAVGMSYDINTSGLSTISAYRGGFEVFLRYSVSKRR